MHHRHHHSPPKLSGAVGALLPANPSATMAGINASADVKLVQQLLNRAFHDVPTFRSLSEDGRCGPKTIAAISDFQRRYLHSVKADGRVDPHGKTIAVLIEKAGKPFPTHVTSFLHTVASAAKTAAKNWNVPASVLIAQAAHESAWGRQVKGNAYFGIKGKSPTGNSTSFKTSEVVAGKSISITDSFRAYKDFSEAADDYGRFLNENSRYSGCFAFSKDPDKFVDVLAQAGYATDPDYARKIKNIIRKYWLADYDR